MKWLFKLRGDIPDQWKLPLSGLGVGIILAIWFVFTSGENPLTPSKILPKPLNVFGAFSEMYQENNLIKNLFRSVGLNLAGYIKAVLWTIPIGFLIGLFPVIRGMFQRPLDAIRFVPIAAAIGLFIGWFGIGASMKVNFLAFGIFIFLTPIVVQRIFEVKDVYLKTVYTIGATDWQTIKTVYFPSVFSKLIDDIRILTAISWTYIVVIETINSEEGGLGALTYTMRRLSQPDKMYAAFMLIILIGIIQDRIFVRLDRELFPHKYQLKNQDKYGKLKQVSIFDTIMDFAFSAFTWTLLGVYIMVAINEVTGFLSDIKILDFLFGDTCWAFHFLMISIILYKGYGFYIKLRSRKSATPKIVENV
ncbi:MAG: ABC transporter permease subunit [Saprospiraceae bacterium]|nr:ABC transporter permease subunit [Bacteroidia bacterium]NNE14344.1 ABC transporter permease subunit [Saprospiraceae bacterium]NNL92743.1 ABC transporter permease subunit [Saprospiraceae bacterium]